MIFERLNFVPIGAKIYSHRSVIVDNGGKVSYNISANVNYVLLHNGEDRSAMQASYAKKFELAAKYNIPIISSQFIDASIEANQLLEPKSFLFFQSTEEINEDEEMLIEGETENQITDVEAKQKVEKTVIKKSVNMEDGNWREAKVFISSTFKDMHGERDYLTRFVLPELQERCEELKVHVSFVDLRWGVTEDEAKSGQSLELCLELVDQCSFFLGILGSRYGYIPDDYLSCNLEDKKFSWLANFQAGCSITHLEIEFGSFYEREHRSNRPVILFRNQNILDDVPGEFISDFREENDISKLKMRQLKKDLLAKSENGDNNLIVEEYTCGWRGEVDGLPMTGDLDTFGEIVTERLWEQIREEFPVEENTKVIDNLQIRSLITTHNLHTQFTENHSRLFVGREEILQQIKRYVSERSGHSISDFEDIDIFARQVGGQNKNIDHIPTPDFSSPIIILGEPGSGKTSLVAYSTKILKKSGNVVYHFVGAAPSSTSLRATLYRLIQELYYTLNGVEDFTFIPQDLRELKALFIKLLSQGDEESGLKLDKPIVIVLDAVNQMDEIGKPWHFDWLPITLRENVKIVISTLPGIYADALQNILPSNNIIRVGELSLYERTEITSAILLQYGKKLNQNQIKYLISKKDSSRPLFLAGACEELRVFGDYDRLGEKIQSLPETIPQLFIEILSRLERDFGQTLVQAALSLIACSRGGLYEDELRVILENWDTSITPITAEKKLTQTIWTRLERGLRAFLQPTEKNTRARIDFFHEQFLIAVRKKYLSPDSLNANVYHYNAPVSLYKKSHLKLVEYFMFSADPREDKSWNSEGSFRGLSELPYHLTKSEEWIKCIDTLTDLGFIEAKGKIGQIFDLVQEYLNVLESPNLLAGEHDNYKVAIYRKRILEYHQFISSNCYVLHMRPHLTFSIAINLPTKLSPFQTADNRWNSHIEKRPHLRWINKTSEPDPCLVTISSHTMVVSFATFHPNKEVKQILSGSHDISAKIFNTDTGEEVHTLSSIKMDPNVSHLKSINCCNFSPNGKYIVTASWDKSLILWCGISFNFITRLAGHTSVINYCSFSPSSTTIVSGGRDRSLRFWHIPTGTVYVKDNAHENTINCCEYSPDGRYIISSSDDRTVKIFSNEPNLPEVALVKFTHPVLCSKFSPDASIWAAAGGDRKIRLYNIKDYETQPFAVLSGHMDGITCINFSPKKKVLVSCSNDNLILIWDLRTFSCIAKLVGHTGSVFSTSFSPDGGKIVSSSFDRSVKIWKIPEVVDERLLKDAHDGRILAATFSKTGKMVLTASRDKSAKIWTATRGAPGSAHPNPGSLLCTLKGHTSNVFGCSFAPDEKRVITSSRDYSALVWDVHSPQEPIHKVQPENGIVWSCAYSPDGSYFATGSDNLVIFWDSNTFERLHTLYGHRLAINSISFSLDEKKVVTASNDNTLKLWDTQTRRKLGTFRCEHAVNCVHFAPDSKTFVCGTEDGKVIEFDASNGKRLHTLKGHTQPVKGVSYSADGKKILSGSTDSMVLVWDRNGNEISSYACPSRITCLQSSPMGEQLVVGDGSGRFYLLNPIG